MKPGRGKLKGGAYEREVGSKLSLWLSNGQRKDLLRRTEGSGARFTSCSLGNAGDLMAQDPISFKLCSQFVIECKSWRDLQLIRFLNCEGDLYDAMKKVMEEAEKVGKRWMLICKQNRQRDLLLMASAVHASPNLPYHLIFSGSVVMLDFDDFLSLVTPSGFLNE